MNKIADDDGRSISHRNIEFLRRNKRTSKKKKKKNEKKMKEK